MLNILKKTIVVLGPARSGTSTVGGVLNILGVDFGKAFFRVNKINPRGSYEDRDIWKLNQEIFESIDKNRNFWILPPRYEEVMEQKEKFDARIQDIIQQKQHGKNILGLKSPLMSLTIELFLPHLINPLFVIVTRDTCDNAESVVKFTNGVNYDQALAYANYYNKTISEFLNKHSNIPIEFVSFEDMVKNPLEETQKLAEFLDLKLTKTMVRRIHKFVIPRERIELEKKRAALLTPFIVFLFKKVPEFKEKCMRKPKKIPYYIYTVIKNRIYRCIKKVKNTKLNNIK